MVSNLLDENDSWLSNHAWLIISFMLKRSYGSTVSIPLIKLMQSIGSEEHINLSYSSKISEG